MDWECWTEQLNEEVLAEDGEFKTKEEELVELLDSSSLLFLYSMHSALTLSYLSAEFSCS